MGKRSRNVAASRAERQLIAQLTREKAALRSLLKLDLCRQAAAFARSNAREGHSEVCTITSIVTKCHTTPVEAVEWIAIGETILRPSDQGGDVTCTCDYRAESAPLFLQAPSGRDTAADERVEPLFPRQRVTWWQSAYQPYVLRLGRLIRRLLGLRSRLPTLAQPREE
jgi:hypothetical protein